MTHPAVTCWKEGYTMIVMTSTVYLQPALNIHGPPMPGSVLWTFCRPLKKLMDTGRFGYLRYCAATTSEHAEGGPARAAV